MANISRGARAVWERFTADREEVAFESEALRSAVLPASGPAVGRERDTVTRARVNQALFRRMILARYESRCCVTGLAITSLLTASHIVRWADDPSERMNPANGLLLNALHDRAFESGVMTIGDDLRVRIDPDLLASNNEAAQQLVGRYEGRALSTPRGVSPSIELLKRHRERAEAT